MNGDDRLSRWLEGAPLTELGDGAEAHLREEMRLMAGTISAAMVALHQVALALEERADKHLAEVHCTDSTRGMTYGMSNGLRVGANAIGHVHNWIHRRATHGHASAD